MADQRRVGQTNLTAWRAWQIFTNAANPSSITDTTASTRSVGYYRLANP